MKYIAIIQLRITFQVVSVQCTESAPVVKNRHDKPNWISIFDTLPKLVVIARTGSSHRRFNLKALKINRGKFYKEKCNIN